MLVWKRPFRRTHRACWNILLTCKVKFSLRNTVCLLEMALTKRHHFTCCQIPHVCYSEIPEPAFFCIPRTRYHTWVSMLRAPWTLVLWLRGIQHTVWHFPKFLSYLLDADNKQNLIRPTRKITLITGALRDWNTPGAVETVDSGVWDLLRVRLLKRDFSAESF